VVDPKNIFCRPTLPMQIDDDEVCVRRAPRRISVAGLPATRKSSILALAARWGASADSGGFSRDVILRIDRDYFAATRARCCLEGRTAAVRGGTIVAQWSDMSDALFATASMECPFCGRPVAPAPDSTWVVAWYTCPRCSHDWSARIRNGLPDLPLAGEGFVQGSPCKERP